MPTFSTYREASDYQLVEWVAGRPWHNPLSPLGPEHEGPGGGECCPDFSCCAPNMLWPKVAREAFGVASTEDRSRMLYGGLAALVNEHGPKGVYVAGDPDIENSGSKQ